MKRNREKLILILTIIMTISTVLVIFCIKDGHNWGDDFSLYIAQAKSIINFSISDLYKLNKYAVQNSTCEIQFGPYLYPQGFPILLSPVYYCFGMNFFAMKGFCGIFLILSIPLIYQLFKEYFLNSFYIFFIIVGIAFHKEFITFSDNILSDIPFFFFSILTLLLMKKSNTILNQIILGVSICFSYFIRDIGIVLIPTLLTYQIQLFLTEKRNIKNKIFYIIPYLIFASFFVSIFVFLPKGGENHYTMVLSNFSFALLKESILYYSYLVSGYFFTTPVFFLPILIIVFIGMLSTWKQDLYFIAYTAFICIVLIVWPAYQGTRFIFPIIPFILFFLLKGAIYIFDKFTFNVRYLVILLFIFLGRTSLISIKQIIYFCKTDTNQSYTPEMVEIYNYITKNVREKEIIGFFKPRALRLFTDRNAIYTDQYHYAKSNATYLLIEKDEYTSMITKFNKVYETPNYVLITKDL